jgi:hypothetical protein
VEAIPPSVASAPGSTGKKSPVCRSCSLSALRVMPACTLHPGWGGGVEGTGGRARSQPHHQEVEGG